MGNYGMKKLFVFAALMGLFNPQAAIANLGPADVPTSKEKGSTQTGFDAWCVEKYADCVVKLENGRLKVDGSSRITKEHLPGEGS